MLFFNNDKLVTIKTELVNFTHFPNDCRYQIKHVNRKVSQGTYMILILLLLCLTF